MRLKLLLVLLPVLSWQLYAQGHIPAAGGLEPQEDAPYLWRQAVGGVVLGQPVIRGQSVAMVLDGGSLRAISLSGRRLWNFSARGRLSPFLARSREGTSYIGRTNGTLIAVNASGREIWRAGLGEALSGPPVLGLAGRVFAPTPRRVSCFTVSGTLLWRRDFDHAISAGPWPDKSGGILLALESGEALRIGPFGDVYEWRLPFAPCAMVSVRMPDSDEPPPDDSPGPLPGDEVVFAFLRTGEVWALDPLRPCAEPAALIRLPAAPVAAVGRDSRAAVLLSNGHVFMLSAEGGILWTADSHIPLLADALAYGVSLVYDERGVYVLTPQRAAGFEAGGNPLWRSAIVNAAGVPALGGNGVLYAGGVDWILYAWEMEDWRSMQARIEESPALAAPAAAFELGTPPPSLFAGSPMRFNESAVRRELDAIQRGILSGNVGENELQWLAFLKETAEAGIPPNALPAAAQPLVGTAQRIRALQLLSRIGSGENIPWLVRFFGRERDPAVRAAAALAIGGIGFDPCGRAIGTFAAAAAPGNFHSEQVLVSVAAAAGALCRFSGHLVYETGVRALVMLSGAGQPLSVQRQARRELESLAAIF